MAAGSRRRLRARRHGRRRQPDFEPLIDLITTTIKPQTWDEVGGPGSISQFSNNLSLVISQTQEVHEDIADLLEQLRRNQDLQVTIEVRFITLNDNFFERIGVDFQFNIDDNAGNPNTPTQGRAITVGLNTVAGNSPRVNFTPDLDIPFRQSSFNLATPQFGQPVEVAHFGFAILSDIEAYFLINAAQGDRRSNVLQAPKVTLFNGQQAFVSDHVANAVRDQRDPGGGRLCRRPAAGDRGALRRHVPLTVQAVVSNDRRFVRLTVVPFFSQIGDVEEVHVLRLDDDDQEQRAAATSKVTGGDDDEPPKRRRPRRPTASRLQLPTFSFVTVTTTVSVPDGGTVLLGGIKRLSEGRNEFGVPILSKLPYINRLVQERRHRPRNAEPDDDGHAANHHPGRGRRRVGRARRPRWAGGGRRAGAGPAARACLRFF